MELQISHSIWAEVQTGGVFRRKTPGNTKNIKAVMSMKRSRNYRRRSMSGSYTHVGAYPAQNERFGIYGLFERKKCVVNLSMEKVHEWYLKKWGNMKFAYRNREFWCKGYYADTVVKSTKAIKEYISGQLKRDKESDQISMFHPRAPFMGSK